MDILTLVFTLLVVAGLVWGSHWIITHYFPAPMQTFALIIVGILLLMALLYLLFRFLPMPPRLGG